MPARGAFVLAVLACALAAQGASAASSSSTAACHMYASAPFLYGVVIPLSAVECDGVEHRLQISTQLTRDGVTVASETRRCRNASECWLTVDASAPDEPGNQVWCTVTSGWAGTTYIGSATVCETEEF